MDPTAHDSSEHGHEEHLVPYKTYIGVWVALITLTFVTVGAGLADLKHMGIIVAMLIASVKVTLVILYFMHVRWSGKLVWLFAASGFLWLLILFAITFADVISRDWVPIDGMPGAGM